MFIGSLHSCLVVRWRAAGTGSNPNRFLFKKGSVEGFAAEGKWGARATSNRMACPGAELAAGNLACFVLVD